MRNRKDVIILVVALCLLLAACGKSGDASTSISEKTEPARNEETVQQTEQVQETETEPETTPDTESTEQNEAMELLFRWTDTYSGTDIVRQLEAEVSGTASDGSPLQESTRSETGYALCDASGREVVSVVQESESILVLLNDPAGEYEIVLTDGLGYAAYNENGVHNVMYTVTRSGEELMSGNTDDTSWQCQFPTGIWGLRISVSNGVIADP